MMADRISALPLQHYRQTGQHRTRHRRDSTKLGSVKQDFTQLESTKLNLTIT